MRCGNRQNHEEKVAAEQPMPIEPAVVTNLRQAKNLSQVFMWECLSDRAICGRLISMSRESYRMNARTAPMLPKDSY